MTLRLWGFALFLALGAGNYAQAQYISTCETVPFGCPALCGGGILAVRIFQVQRLPNGVTVQAELSDANGNFGGGSQVLPVSQYSTNGGNTYTNGPYTFSGDVSDLYARFIVPATTAVGANYNMRIRASNGFHSSDNFRCPNGGHISITSSSPALPPVPQDAEGQNQWIGHIYAWNPTTSSPLVAPALVNAQSFFSPANYQGHALYDSLSLDLSFSTTGGAPGSTSNGSTFACGGASLQSNFSMRLRRRQVFAPGSYTFSIAGDDGIRLSLDGGATWILSSWVDELYTDSRKTTASASPDGICLSGPVDMVIEYFQHPADARLTFTVTPGANQPAAVLTAQPQALSVCQGDSSRFSVSATGALAYQWQVNGGSGFADVGAAGYSGAHTPTLRIAPGIARDGWLYRCLVIGTSACAPVLASDSAALFTESLPEIAGQPQDQSLCAGDTARFSISVTKQNYGIRWQQSEDGTAWTDIPMGALFTGMTTTALTAVGLPSGIPHVSVRAVLTTPCGTEVFSQAAQLTACCVLPELSNILLPNGREANRHFGIHACALDGFTMAVYDRWGRKVYVTAEPAAGWDGSDMPAGTYFYRIAYSYQGQPAEKRGFVELMR